MSNFFHGTQSLNELQIIGNYWKKGESDETKALVISVKLLLIKILIIHKIKKRKLDFYKMIF
jgi:phosphatidylserine synthase